MIRDTIAVILGGGKGERLYPLTKNRAKPAVPIAGKFRLVDIPISNCIDSEVDRIFVGIKRWLCMIRYGEQYESDTDVRAKAYIGRDEGVLCAGGCALFPIR